MKDHALRIAGLMFLLLVPPRLALADNTYLLQAPAPSVPAIALRHGLTIVSPPDAHDLSVVSQNDARTPDQVIAEVQQDPDVQEIESQVPAIVPEIAISPRLSQSTAAILDALAGAKPTSYYGTSVWKSYVNQKAANLIGMADTHKSLATGAGIVAVLDTGVDPGVPLLQGSLVPGYDFVNGVAGGGSEWSDMDPTTAAILSQASSSSNNVAIQLNQSTAAILDQSTAAILDTTKVPIAFGHGTMVAGIIHLVAPTAQIMPLKVFKADGSANITDIVRAVYYAVDNGARVINMSFSMSGTSAALVKAITYADEHNVTCVAAAGNEGAQILRFPGAYRDVIGVASTDNTDARSSFSNYGEGLVDIAAPGEGIVTAYPGGHYAVVSGTSFSAPLVSGAVALMVQLNNDLNQHDASKGLLDNAKDLATDALGAGRLDLFETLNAIR